MGCEFGALFPTMELNMTKKKASNDHALGASRKSGSNVANARLANDGAVKPGKTTSKIGQRQPATGRTEPELLSDADCRKELKRLRTILAKLTATGGSSAKQRYFDEKWLAARWGQSVKYVRAQRYKGEGPRVTYLGRSVRYRLREVQAYEAANTFPSRIAKDQASKQ